MSSKHYWRKGSEFLIEHSELKGLKYLLYFAIYFMSTMSINFTNTIKDLNESGKLFASFVSFDGLSLVILKSIGMISILWISYFLVSLVTNRNQKFKDVEVKPLIKIFVIRFIMELIALIPIYFLLGGLFATSGEIAASMITLLLFIPLSILSIYVSLTMPIVPYVVNKFEDLSLWETIYLSFNLAKGNRWFIFKMNIRTIPAFFLSGLIIGFTAGFFLGMTYTLDNKAMVAFMVIAYYAVFILVSKIMMKAEIKKTAGIYIMLEDNQ